MGFDIEKLHGILFEMLEEIDRICSKNDIKYSLFAGSALGAVRHGGFIPWDDDLDIVMLRPDYEKFLRIADKELSSAFFLQKEFSEHWPMFFSKLRKNGTAYMEKMFPKDSSQHQGIYIDVFPCDNLSDSKFKRKIQFFASKAVIASSLGKRGYLTDSIGKKVFICFSKILPQKALRRIVVNKNEPKSEFVHTFFGASSRYDKSVFRREIMNETHLLPFCGKKFPVSSRYDEMLSILYGDYMTLPQEKDRKCKEHAMLVDFENSYEKYIDWQKKQRITTYTRSIR